MKSKPILVGAKKMLGKGFTSLATTKIGFFMTYNEYLKTPHWKKTRERLLRAKKPICKFCGEEKNINVHHRIYKEKGQSVLFNERNHQLTPLYAGCHSMWHKYHGKQTLRSMDFVRGGLLIKLGATKKQAIMLSTNRVLGIEHLQKQLDRQIMFPRWGNATC